MLNTLTINELYKLRVRLIKSKNKYKYNYFMKVLNHNIILKMIERSKAHGTI